MSLRLGLTVCSVGLFASGSRLMRPALSRPSSWNDGLQHRLQPSLPFGPLSHFSTAPISFAARPTPSSRKVLPPRKAPTPPSPKSQQRPFPPSSPKDQVASQISTTPAHLATQASKPQQSPKQRQSPEQPQWEWETTNDPKVQTRTVFARPYGLDAGSNPLLIVLWTILLGVCGAVAWVYLPLTWEMTGTQETWTRRIMFLNAAVWIPVYCVSVRKQWHTVTIITMVKRDGVEKPFLMLRHGGHALLPRIASFQGTKIGRLANGGTLYRPKDLGPSVILDFEGTGRSWDRGYKLDFSEAPDILGEDGPEDDVVLSLSRLEQAFGPVRNASDRPQYTEWSIGYWLVKLGDRIWGKDTKGTKS